MMDNVMASYRPEGKVDYVCMYVCMYVSCGAHICYAGNWGWMIRLVMAEIDQ